MLYTYKPMTTVVFSVVRDLNLGLTVRTLNIFDTMYNVFTSFHSIDKHNTEQLVSRARKTSSSLFPPRCCSRYYTNILLLTAQQNSYEIMSCLAYTIQRCSIDSIHYNHWLMWSWVPISHPTLFLTC